jgi:hypothetical protein
MRKYHYCSIVLSLLLALVMFSCSAGTDVIPQRDKAWVSPHRLEPGTSRSTVQSSNHYTYYYHCTHIYIGCYVSG